MDADFDADFDFSAFPFDAQTAELIFESRRGVHDVQLRENCLVPSDFDDSDLCQNTNAFWRLNESVKKLDANSLPGCWWPDFLHSRSINAKTKPARNRYKKALQRQKSESYVREISGEESEYTKIEMDPKGGQIGGKGVDEDGKQYIWEYEKAIPDLNSENEWKKYLPDHSKQLEKAFTAFSYGQEQLDRYASEEARNSEDFPSKDLEHTDSSGLFTLASPGRYPSGCFFVGTHSDYWSKCLYFVDFDLTKYATELSSHYKCKWADGESSAPIASHQGALALKADCLFFWQHQIDGHGVVRRCRRRNASKAPPTLLTQSYGFLKPDFHHGIAEPRPDLQFHVHLERVPDPIIEKYVYMINAICVFATFSFWLPFRWVTNEVSLGTRIEIVGAALLTLISFKASMPAIPCKHEFARAY